MQRAQLRVREFAWLFALVTQPADEPLRSDCPNGRRNKKWLYAEVDQTRDCRGGIISVQRAENKMAGQTGIRCDARSLEVTNLSHHDDVRRLAQHGTQRSRKRHADLAIHLYLVDSAHLVFDRFFDGDDFAVRLV